MKLAVILLALVAVVASRNIDYEDLIDLEDNTAYGYLTKIGLPLANKLRAAESRIVGGQHASAGQFPYQAGLLISFGGGQGVCGGVIVTANRVLTAAHCWFDGVNQASAITVVLGSVTLFTGGTRLTTSSVNTHENWQPNLIRNDIAIINLPSNIAPSNVISYATLPSGNQLNEDFVGSTGVASGFGLTSDGGSINVNQVLSFVNVPVITNTVCWASFPVILQASNICTSGANGMSPCSGDSGGPLVVQRNGPLLIGLVSFGSGRGCQVGAPAVYVRVTYYDAWIRARL